jgi:tetraacyldisaccharide 4'-kinase
MVRWVCGELARQGRHPAVVMRGHRGGESSDEALEHRSELARVPVAVGADRRAAIDRLVTSDASVDALVLDDGFQHRQVARDLDLVLVDASRPALDGPLLPLGWLREPAEGLARAGAVIVTHADAIDSSLSARIAEWHGRPPVAWTRHAWNCLRVTAASQGQESWSLERLRGRSVAVWAGIGNRSAFVSQVKACGARVVDVPGLADHHAYDARGVERLAARARRAGATEIVCTGKDWVKLRLLPLPATLTVLRPELRMEFVAGEPALQAMLAEAMARGDARVRR